MKAVLRILDTQDSFGNTALHLACVDGSEECVRMLIEVLIWQSTFSFLLGRLNSMHITE